MNWIDIPACRVLEVTRVETGEYFKLFGEDGEPLKQNGLIYRAIRKSDSRVFKIASFIPLRSYGKDCLYFEEV